MRKISCKLFFGVLKTGLCQFIVWFLGLFGYKRSGWFAKCVWALFAFSFSVFMAVIAYAGMVAAWKHTTEDSRNRKNKEMNGGDEFVSDNIGFIESYDYHDGYLFNKLNYKKTLTGIDWIALPEGKDTSGCYSNGKLRGFFGINSGKEVIKPKYRHAWVFSEGLAGVVEDGMVKFIDAIGKVVIDNKIKYNNTDCNFIFHNGFCIMYGCENEKYGLMNKKGKMVLPFEYSNITLGKDYSYWSATGNDTTTVYDRNLNKILVTNGNVQFADETIDVVMSDNTIRKYDYRGKLLDGFYIEELRSLEYETDEIYYTADEYTNDYNEKYVSVTEYRKKAVARLYAYTAGYNHEGLMTPDGRIVTNPMYKYIEAIGYDTYLCTVGNGHKIVVNGRDNR